MSGQVCLPASWRRKGLPLLTLLGSLLAWLLSLGLAGTARAADAAASAPGRAAPAAADAASAPLVLRDAAGTVAVWPWLTHWSDPGGEADLAQARAALPQFTRPATARATLGLRKDAVWLHVPFTVAPDSNGEWVLDIDYAVLNRVDVYLLGSDGRPVFTQRLGNFEPFTARPLKSRTPAAALPVRPGGRYELMLRVQTLGAMIVPITLNQPADFHARALREQALQGLLTGFVLCLLLYSLVQWRTLREPLFAKYAVLIGGGLFFPVVQFGLGAQYLWTDNLWLEQHLAGLAALTASAGTFLFVEHVLVERGRQGLYSAVMFGGAALLGMFGVLYAFDLIDVHVVSTVIGTLGLMPALMGLPGAVRLARQGNPVGWYFLVAWLGYFITTFIAVSVIKGRLPATFWTLHAFQIGALIDAVLFLRVVGLRLEAMHEVARSAAHEASRLRDLAESDPLTGLPNRRGLSAALAQALPNCRPERMLALMMLDLDGFKLVNDTHGHDQGDRLLAEVATRLRGNLRSADVVARLGGDEFIVMAEGLKTEAQARELGWQLIDALSAPFRLQEETCHIGVTIGYVLAPEDGLDATALLKRADAAMYQGKMSGKGCLMRGEGVVGLV
jgi:diguanylate cyclase (GGDEF)-like protein